MRKQVTIAASDGKTLKLTRYGSEKYRVGKLERVVYVADDGTFWSRYACQYNEVEKINDWYFATPWLRFGDATENL